MAEQITSKRARTVVNYAALDSLDISDDDEFAGFSSPTTATKQQTTKKINEQSKLQKRKSSQSVESGSVSCTSSIENDDEEGNCFVGDSTRQRSTRPRPSIQEKVFQRDLEAAIELSKQSAELPPTEDIDSNNKENEINNSDSEAPSSPCAPLTILSVPVEVHTKERLKHPCARIPSLTNTFTFPPSSITPGEQKKLEVIDEASPASHHDANEVVTAVLVNQHKKHSQHTKERIRRTTTVSAHDSLRIGEDATDGQSRISKGSKRKACIIDSDDDEDDFSSSRRLMKKTPKSLADNKKNVPCLPENKCKDGNDTDVTPLPKNDDTLGEDDSSIREDCIVDSNKAAGKPLLVEEEPAKKVSETPEPLMDAVTECGRGRRTRRPAAVIEDSDSDSEKEWAEEDELDQDDLSESLSEGSDFQPSPKKNKRELKNSKNTSKNLVKNTRYSSINTRGGSSNREKTITSKTLSVTKNNKTVSSNGSDTKSSRIYTEKNLYKNDHNNKAINDSNDGITKSSDTSNFGFDKYAEPRSSSSRNSAVSKSCVRKPADSSSRSASAAPSQPSVNNVLSSKSGAAVHRSVAAATAGPALARSAFKSPVLGSGDAAVGGGRNAALSGSPTSGTLRLGLSRKANFKSLHPNATVK